ncbi:MAG TPA: hypothetical protein VIK84_05790 [Haloplasmataceae bacterium]
MYPQQPFVEQGFYGQTPYFDGMYQPQPMPFVGPKGFPKPQKPMPGSLIGDPQYNIDARLDRIEREIIEINRQINALQRQVRRLENMMNIRDNHY